MKSKINVYCRLKPKTSKKSKVCYQILNEGKSNPVQKLVLTNMAESEKQQDPSNDKIKSNI